MVNKCYKKDFQYPKLIEKNIKYTFTKEEDQRLIPFQKVMRDTWKMLVNKGFHNINNYAAHFPFRVESEKIQSLSNVINFTEEAFIFEVLYFNYYKSKYEPIDSLKSGHYTPEDIKINPKAKILNHNNAGYIYQPWIINLLYKLFNSQSKYEKDFNV
jgi:hypothetical protein